jgi:uncharacterized protein (TIGR03083 family)
MSDALGALRSSVDRLTDLVTGLDDEALVQQAYPSAWTVADVLSHLGSGAEIWIRRIDDAQAGRETSDDLAPSVWARWDARTPRQQADDGLATGRAFLERLLAVPEEERGAFSLDLGPLDLDWDAFLGLRLNEALLHEWDVAVTFDAAATLGGDGVEHVVDNLAMVAGWTAKATGTPRVVTVETTEPDRGFTIDIGDEAVTFTSGVSAGVTTLVMPAEAFVRLVYGRLDADHTPASVSGDVEELDQLRAVFPGP